MNPVIVDGRLRETDAGRLRLKKTEINRVESISRDRMEAKMPLTFVQAMQNERGVDAQTSCAFCGAKRLTINGMRGEHTTILVDGLPLHSTVSGFYGIEAIPLGAIETVEVYRGAGRAQGAPESIGGAINIITRDPISTETEVDGRVAQDGQFNQQIFVSKKINEQSGLLFGASHGEITPVDLDGNGIAELPRQNTQSFFAKLDTHYSDTSYTTYRFSIGQLDTIGGTMNRNRLTGPQALADDPSSHFINRDVRNRYTGDENKITDNVRVDRYEGAIQHIEGISEALQLKFAVGGAIQNQRSIYSHGYDYDNDDELYTGLIEAQWAASANHLLTFQIDAKNQRMASRSIVLFQGGLNLPKDSFEYASLGGSIQDTWIVSEKLELASSLRFDQIRTHWKELGRTIDQPVFAPRILAKYSHSSEIASRLSYGLGYRSPLTLFESQHGTDHYGFIVDITDIERAHSVVYSLAGQFHDDFFEVGAHFTEIENMAYGLDRADENKATIFRNAQDPYLISVVDFSYGHRFSEKFSIETLAEFFNYPTGYKEKLPVAALENRFSVVANYTIGAWTIENRLTAVGERDLRPYRYYRHFNVASVGQDINDIDNFGILKASEQKLQKAPWFATFDFSLKRDIAPGWQIGINVINAFNYTQTGHGDSPTTWHVHGDHYHLDNFHIWGPLRGRQVFASLRGSW